VSAPPRKISWIVAPPEVCCLCKEPLGAAAETSSWNGAPAHRECVRVHLLQRDPAFREPEAEEYSDEPGEGSDGPTQHDDDESDPG
jgi:hypothetical protein